MLRLVRHYLAKFALSTIDRFYNTPSADRDRMLRLAFSYAADESVAGDYLEFGVYQGRTFTYACKASQQESANCHLYAFDSFQGFPKPESIDALFKRFKQGECSSGRHFFERQLTRHGVDMKRVTIVDGWFKETLSDRTRARLGLQHAMVVYVDCDLYASTVPVLEFITPLLQDGTVILFDDWFCYRADPHRGQQRAVSEWLATHPHIRLFEWRQFAVVGQAYFVHLRDRKDQSAAV